MSSLQSKVALQLPTSCRAPTVNITTTTTQSVNSIPLSDSYSNDELLNALDSLWKDSSDPDFDARHIHGYKDANHKLSMLQIITATRLLDYQQLFKQENAPTLDDMIKQAREEFGQPDDNDNKNNNNPFNILNLQRVIQEQAPRMALAAEFKRASPSKGVIAAANVDAGEQARQYAMAGANIVSVLTETRWFQGTLDDMRSARASTSSSDITVSSYSSRPAILRKDFIVTKYQIAEAVANGADTVLLIVAVLPQHLLKQLIDYCRDTFNMEPLVEVHADVELQVALQAGAKVIGVNNRNLHTFQMDMNTSERVAQALKEQNLTFAHTTTTNNNSEQHQQLPEYTLCALSGMSTASDVHRYRQAGLGMCLIGESLMRARDPALAIRSLCLHPNDYYSTQQHQNGSDTVVNASSAAAYTGNTKIIKVCGITSVKDALVACQAGANLIGVIFAEKSKRKVEAVEAKAIVQAVRNFGERTSRIDVNMSNATDNNVSPILHLQMCANALADVSNRRPLVVGVFQNQDPAFIRGIVQECCLDLVQLHGNEGFAAANVKECSVPAIRVVDIVVGNDSGGDGENDSNKAPNDIVDTILGSLTTDPVAILLDTAIKGCKGGSGGGTGTKFDWSIAERIQAAGLPVMLAGGLNADSVKVAVTGTRPFGVDVSSGVEVSPGIKDHAQVQAFVHNALEAAIEANKGF